MSARSAKLLQKLEGTFLVLAAAAALTAILINLEFNLLEANLYDFRMIHGSKALPNRDIVLITLDETTTQALSETSPLTLDWHVKFLEALEAIKPKAVGYLVDMNRVSELNPAMISGVEGYRFFQTSLRLQKAGIPLVLGTPFDVTGEVMPPFPLGSIAHSIAVIHKDGNVFAEDKITRRALTYLYDRPVFQMDLAQRMGLVPKDFRPKGSFNVPEVEGQYFFFRYHGNTVLPTSQSYSTYSFSDVLNGKIPTENLRGKILLVGTLNREDSSDFAFTPYSKASFSSPKLVIHANILDSILRNDGITRAPQWFNICITFTLISLVLGWVLVSEPLSGVFATLGLSLLFMVMAEILFGVKGFWIRASQPLVGIFLAYYLIVPYRLIREYKKRWDYQQKTELLMQVEVLKTNFLSLVTHDLKTPVARIQGLAEVLLNKASERLLERDKESLHHIVDSTDELNRFISSILELSKVEAKSLTPQWQSKDINQLVENCAENFKAPARAKKIKLHLNLEPLFPIRVDPALISKVLNNLIDNAVKYSPTGSDIWIETKEEDSKVKVSIRDQGIGMTEDEQMNLFTRFYRAKNDTTSRVAGTGLGLYLTKYFVEMHRGSVTVQSAPGQGTCFEITLPIEAVQAEGSRESSGLTRFLKFRRSAKENPYV